MKLTYAVALSIVQGLTEFLPVSSSGHLVLLQRLFAITKPPVFFDVILHGGTLLAIFVFFYRRIVDLTKETLQALFQGQLGQVPRIVWLILIGSVPAAIVGLAINKYLTSIFSSLTLLALSYLATSLFLFSTFWLKKKTAEESNQFGWLRALWVGIFQAIAILPGISRSGSTIVGGEWLGLTREKAFEFSFLLSIPAISGALILQLSDVGLLTSSQFLSLLLGFAIAAVVGWFSLKALEKLVISDKLYLFGIYTLALSVLSLVLGVFI